VIADFVPWCLKSRKSPAQAQQYHRYIFAAAKAVRIKKLVFQEAKATTGLKPKTKIFWYLGFLPCFFGFLLSANPIHRNFKKDQGFL
jgi:hypothetical protein